MARPTSLRGSLDSSSSRIANKLFNSHPSIKTVSFAIVFSYYLLTFLLVTFPTAPKIEVSAPGDIIYSEVNHEGVRKLEAYLEEMASGTSVPDNVNIQKVQDDVLKLWNVVKSQPGIGQDQKNNVRRRRPLFA